MNGKILLLGGVLGALLLGGVLLSAAEPVADSGEEGLDLAQAMAPDEVTYAKAILLPLGDGDVRGTVTFSQTETGIRIDATVTGLTPGSHGFHIHEYGDCGAPDGSSAGDHFNPDRMTHGGPESEQRHVGDLGNITAGADGTGTYTWTDTMVQFDGPRSILGRGVIVHADPDDYVSQPGGDAGPRVACGVIGVAAPVE